MFCQTYIFYSVFRYEASKLYVFPIIQKICAVIWILIAAVYVYPMVEHWAFYRISSSGPFVATIGRLIVYVECVVT